MDSNKNDAMKMQEEKRQARTLENMEIKLSEQMEMMKQLITTSAVISIDELCFHFRTAVQTESVNVPLHLSFERHFKLLIDYARNDRNVLSGLLHCLNSLYECYRTVTPEYYFDRVMTRAFQDSILESFELFSTALKDYDAHDRPINLDAPYLKHYKRFGSHPHKQFYHTYLQKLNEKLNYLLSESRLGLKLDSCFIPENSYNIILEQSLVEDLYAFLVDEKCLQKDDDTERDFKLLFNNSVFKRNANPIRWIKTTEKSQMTSNITLRTLFLVLGEKTKKNLLDQEHRRYYESLFIGKNGKNISLEDKTNKDNKVSQSLRFFLSQLQSILKL